jgi:hypothetical protein
LAFETVHHIEDDDDDDQESIEDDIALITRRLRSFLSKVKMRYSIWMMNPTQPLMSCMMLLNLYMMNLKN